MLGDRNEGMSILPRLNHILFEGSCRLIDQGLTEGLFKFLKIEGTDQVIKSVGRNYIYIYIKARTVKSKK